MFSICEHPLHQYFPSSIVSSRRPPPSQSAPSSGLLSPFGSATAVAVEEEKHQVNVVHEDNAPWAGEEGMIIPILLCYPAREYDFTRIRECFLSMIEDETKIYLRYLEDFDMEWKTMPMERKVECHIHLKVSCPSSLKNFYFSFTLSKIKNHHVL